MLNLLNSCNFIPVNVYYILQVCRGSARVGITPAYPSLARRPRTAIQSGAFRLPHTNMQHTAAYTFRPTKRPLPPVWNNWAPCVSQSGTTRDKVETICIYKFGAQKTSTPPYAAVTSHGLFLVLVTQAPWSIQSARIRPRSPH